MISQEEYSNAYVEVLEILKNIPEEELHKVPEDLIKKFEEKKSNEYKFTFNRNKSLNKQISSLTKAILSNLYKNYWATDFEKRVIIAKEKSNRQQMEQIKIEKFSNIKLFKK